MGELIAAEVLRERRMAEEEDRIADLPRGAAQRSFQVFAEWLKDNRKSIERRLDSQDEVLSEIRHETKRTNGRVTDLEKDVALQQALAQGKHEWDTELAEDHEKRSSRWEHRAIAAVGVLGGGVTVALGHALHFW